MPFPPRKTITAASDRTGRFQDDGLLLWHLGSVDNTSGADSSGFVEGTWYTAPDMGRGFMGMLVTHDADGAGSDALDVQIITRLNIDGTANNTHVMLAFNSVSGASVAGRTYWVFGVHSTDEAGGGVSAPSAGQSKPIWGNQIAMRYDITDSPADNTASYNFSVYLYVVQ